MNSQFTTEVFLLKVDCIFCNVIKKENWYPLSLGNDRNVKLNGYQLTTHLKAIGNGIVSILTHLNTNLHRTQQNDICFVALGREEVAEASGPVLERETKPGRMSRFFSDIKEKAKFL